MEFDRDGTLLIYKYKHSYWRSFTNAASTLVPTYACFYLATKSTYIRKLYLEMFDPLLVPVLLIGGIVGAWRSFKMFANNTVSMHEVRLKSDGIHLEISFLDWLGRDNVKSRYTMDIRDLRPPPLHGDSFPLKGDLFPHLVEGFEIKNEFPNRPWIKYHQNIRKKVYIHKDYIYMDRELMVAVMNGFYIGLIDKPIV